MPEFCIYGSLYLRVNGNAVRFHSGKTRLIVVAEVAKTSGRLQSSELLASSATEVLNGIGTIAQNPHEIAPQPNLWEFG